MDRRRKEGIARKGKKARQARRASKEGHHPHVARRGSASEAVGAGDRPATVTTTAV